MAHYGTGTFFGYRALGPPAAAVGGGRTRRLFSGIERWPLRLSPEELDLLNPSYRYAIFAGDAQDDYQEVFVPIGFLTTKIHCRIWDNPAEVVLSYDGETAISEEYTQQGFHRMKFIRAFRIRNYVPGMVARYQFMFY